MNLQGGASNKQIKALAEPFKRADALKAAETGSARIDQLVADAAKPEEPAPPEPPAESRPPHGGRPVPAPRRIQLFPPSQSGSCAVG